MLNQFHQDSNRALNAAYFLRLDIMLVALGAALICGLLLIGSELLMVKWVIEERETFLGAMFASFLGFVVWNYGGFQIAQNRVGAVGGHATGLIRTWMLMQDLFIALERSFELLDADNDIENPPQPVDVPEPIEVVEWKGVRFGYDSDQPVLDGLDLIASKGTITAIVGPTGSGKSTLMSLLLRLFDPDAGVVSLNGVDLRSMRIEDIRSNVSIALQKNVLFANTVEGNIAFGYSKVDRDAVVAAAKIADAHDFIEALPDGYDTELGERGSKLSAGQRQRISIARAVYRQTPILILDEPTASLDSRTEQRVLDNLREWSRDRVVFLITHRLSTIRLASQIAVLADGHFVEVGSHDQLMEIEEGRYRRLVETESSASREAGL